MNARQEKLGRDDALRLAQQASRIIVARGKRVATFDMKRDPPADELLLKHILGPTGNLRAPAIRKGRTLLVGFNAEVYDDVI